MLSKFLCLVFSCILSACAASTDWRTANKDSAGLAPLPKDEPQAVVMVFGARAYNWRGYFGVHSWIATKEKNASTYVTYQVIGWNSYRNQSVVVIKEDLPDRNWFGAKPKLYAELRGEKAERAIPKIIAAAKSYPYQMSYRMFPGPNSNTFVSHLLRNTPEIGVELPSSAIGRNWIDDGDIVGWSESGTGFQVSLLGLLGFTVGLGDGVEINILGLDFGIDIWRPALKLPFIGRLGFPDAPVF